MHDRLFESDTFAQPLDLAQYRRPLVLAPHPDDEVFGCGGLLARWAALGVSAHVVVLTHGHSQLGDATHADDRIQESQRAADALGVQVQAWGLGDRALRCDDELIGRLVALIEARQPDVVLAPALCEPHPDHQATALALCCALSRLGPGCGVGEVLLYESGGALTHASVLVDITPVLEVKARALQAFESQEAAQPYRSRITARDHFRAMTLGPSVQAAEAFQRVDLQSQGWPAWVPALEPLFMHARGQAAQAADLPLVSVLVRTVGDAHLERTLASVWAQTYARVEVVVVAAHGQPEPPPGLPVRSGSVMRWVCPGGKLNRPQAANAALQQAQGEWLIFLDDDDLWSPEHLHKLVAAVRGSGQVRAAHTDVRVEDLQGRELTRYAQPYAPQRLAFTNVFPIHSVLFERRMVADKGLRFDETLPVLEDWDFWLQLTEHTDVLHVPGMSAIYRYRDRSGLQAQDHQHHHRQWRDQVQARWLERLPRDRVLQAIAWTTAALDQAQQEAGAAERDRVPRASHEAEVAEWIQREQAVRVERDAQHERVLTLEARLRDTQTELQMAGQRLEQAAHLQSLVEELRLQTAQADGARRELADQTLRETAALRTHWQEAQERWAAEHAQAQVRLTQAQAHEAVLQDQLAELRGLREQSGAREEQLQGQVQDLGREVAVLEAQRHVLQERLDEQIALREGLLAQTVSLRTQLDQAQMDSQRLDTVRAELQSVRVELAVSRAGLASAESALAGIQAELQASRADLQDAHHSLQAVHRSTSWKITAPLRAVGALLIRLGLRR